MPAIVSVELGLRLLASSAVGRADIEAALLAHTEGASFIRALLDRGAISEEVLSQELAKSELPFLRKVIPIPALAKGLPPGLCDRLLAVPVRRDPYTGTVDVAVVDPFESHLIAELSFHLGAGVRLVRAPLGEVERALSSLAAASSPNIPFEMSSSPKLLEEGEVDDEEDEPFTASGAPPTQRGPFSPRAPHAPFADLEPFVEKIRRAADRDAVVEGLVSGMQTVARRVGVLLVKRSEIVGFTCNAELAEIESFRALRIPTRAESILGVALSSRGYLGPIPRGEGNDALLATMKEATRDVSVTRIEVAGRSALLLLADELGDTLLGTKRAARLSKVAGEALTRLVRESR